MHQIGEVADAVGLSLRTIRHWDDEGVVVPSGRSTGGFRLYTDRDIDRLRQVKRIARPLNLSLQEIRDLFTTREQLAKGTGHNEVLTERLSMYVALVNEQCERLREQLAHATEFSRTLQHEIRTAPRRAPAGDGRQAV